MALTDGTSFYDFKKKKEDRVVEVLDKLGGCELYMAYKYLRNKHGISMENMDSKIDDMTKKEYLAGKV